MISPSAEFWDQENWFALQTRSRHEKLIDGELRKKGIETFLPLRTITRRWSDRFKKIEEPLFSGYLFVRIAPRNRLQILETKGSVRLVGFGPSPSPVPEKELGHLRHFIEEKIAVDPFPYLAAGDRVYVRSGLLKGVEGFIIRKDRYSRLVISLDLLAKSVSVEIDESRVEKI